MNAWVLIAACCVISGARGQYSPVRGHYGAALAFAPGAGFAGGVNPYAAHQYAAHPYGANPFAASAAAAALGAGGGATQLTLAPQAALFGHAHQQQQFVAPGFSTGAGNGLLGAGYGAQAPPQLIVSPVLHQDGVAGLMPAGAPNYGRSTVTHYGGGGSSQVTRYQPTTYTAGGASSAGATGSRTQYQQAQQLTASPGSTSALYREPKALPSLSSLPQLQSGAAPAGATVTVQEVGQAQLGALNGYGGAPAGLFSGYGAAAAPRTANYGYGAGLRAYQ
ncbi:protein encore-like isoform X2 [Dermacentor albipictus]|uniref:protein encore-like isoform X2 n=1 Tax=Dermacentor albipictus TaxID=60249 RepID=UPI0038FC2F52